VPDLTFIKARGPVARRLASGSYPPITQYEARPMNQLCFQCQEAAKGVGCSTKGVCGKTLESAGLQDLLVFTLKGLAVVAEAAEQRGRADAGAGAFVCKALFSTITNVNFDGARIEALIDEGLARRNALKAEIGLSCVG
jgi:hydroxylamine reductase